MVTLPHLLTAPPEGLILLQSYIRKQLLVGGCIHEGSLNAHVISSRNFWINNMAVLMLCWISHPVIPMIPWPSALQLQ